MTGAGPQPPVEPARDPVEPEVGPHGVDPRRLVGLRRPQPDLAGCQQLPAADHGGARGQPLGVGLVVPAPRDVHRVDLAVAEAETGCPGGEQQRRVVARPPVAPLPAPRPERQRVALRGPLPDPATGQVQQLGGDGGQRQDHPQRAEVERRRRWIRVVVDQPVGDAQHPLVRQLPRGVQRQGRDLVAGGDLAPSRERVRHRVEAERRRPGRAAADARRGQACRSIPPPPRAPTRAPRGRRARSGSRPWHGRGRAPAAPRRRAGRGRRPSGRRGEAPARQRRSRR